MKKKVLVTGASGLVGSRFVELYSQSELLLIPSENQLDITDSRKIKSFLTKYKADVIVNFAAYTDVSAAEKERGDKKGPCWKINLDGVRNLVDSTDSDKTHFIQISTDFVFSGTNLDPGPYIENHPLPSDSTNLNWYGYTKAEAEKVVKENLGQNYSILRLIYPVRANYDAKLDYLRKPLKLYDDGKLYPLFDNQKISITFIDETCRVLEKIINENIYGIFHASSPDTTTPFEIVSYMLEKVRGVKDVVEEITLEEYLEKIGEPAYRYPKHGGLSVNLTEQKLGIKFSPWRQIVDKLVSQGLGQKEK